MVGRRCARQLQRARLIDLSRLIPITIPKFSYELVAKNLGTYYSCRYPTAAVLNFGRYFPGILYEIKI
eukprot:SAG31_NODE_34669_length_330_cov_1.337662_1_plen_67_part_10